MSSSFATLYAVMREIEGDLSAYHDVHIPEDMRRDPLKNPAFEEIDCPRGPSRRAAFETYQFIHDLFATGMRYDFRLSRPSVVRAYELVRARQKPEGQEFTLLHVLFRGMYTQLRYEQEEKVGTEYQTILQTNQLIDETIQWLDSRSQAK